MFLRRSCRLLSQPQQKQQLRWCSPASSSQVTQLDVELRDLVGTNVSKRLRKAGRLPSVLYGPGTRESGTGPRLLVSVDQRAIEREMRRRGRSMFCTLYEAVGVDTHNNEPFTERVVLRDLQVHPGL